VAASAFGGTAKEVKKISKTKLHASLLAGPLDVDSEAPPTSYQLCTRFLQELALQYPNLCEGACHKGTEKKYAWRLEQRGSGARLSRLFPLTTPASPLQVRLAVDAGIQVQPAGGAAVPAAGADADAGSRSVRRRRPARPARSRTARASTAPDAPSPLLSSPQPANGQSARQGGPARHSRQPTRDGGARESAAAAAVPPATAVPHATAGHARHGTRVAPPSVSVARGGNHHDAPPAGNCTAPAAVLFIPRRRLPSVAAQGAHHSLPSRANGNVYGVSSRCRQAAGGHRRRGSASHLLPGRRRRDQDGVHGAEFRRRCVLLPPPPPPPSTLILLTPLLSRSRLVPVLRVLHRPDRREEV
jgi:hypothetical protein